MDREAERKAIAPPCCGGGGGVVTGVGVGVGLGAGVAVGVGCVTGVGCGVGVGWEVGGGAGATPLKVCDQTLTSSSHQGSPEALRWPRSRTSVAPAGTGVQ